MIDLNDYAPPILAWLTETVQEFAAEHPDKTVSCIAITAVPHDGHIGLSFEVDDARADDGNFDAWSFEYLNFGDFACEAWRDDFYSGGTVRKLKNLKGLIVSIPSALGDEAWERPVFEVLIGLLKQVPSTKAFQELRKHDHIWAGVAFGGSKHRQFFPAK